VFQVEAFWTLSVLGKMTGPLMEFVWCVGAPHGEAMKIDCQPHMGGKLDFTRWESAGGFGGTADLGMGPQ